MERIRKDLCNGHSGSAPQWQIQKEGGYQDCFEGLLEQRNGSEASTRGRPDCPLVGRGWSATRYSANPAGNKAKRKVAAIVHRIEDTDDADDGSTKDGVQVTQLLPRLLSEELQLYFSRITTAMERGGRTPVERQQQDAALKSLAQDPGLQELVPFMINYVAKNLYMHVGNPEHCRTLIRMAHSLLVNPHLHLELYVSHVITLGCV